MEGAETDNIKWQATKFRNLNKFSRSLLRDESERLIRRLPPQDFPLAAGQSVPIVPLEGAAESGFRHREAPRAEPFQVDRQERRAVPAAGEERGEEVRIGTEQGDRPPLHP